MKLKPDSKIIDLAASPLLHRLSHGELVVYIALVAATVHRGKKFKIKNEELANSNVSERTVPRALKVLERLGLVTLKFDEYNMRTIEVL